MFQWIVGRACAGFLLIAPLTGCGMLPADRLEQCRSESEQLVSEYRQQRDRAERLELENRTLNEQIAVAEKRLALADGASGQRVATRQGPLQRGFPGADSSGGAERVAVAPERLGVAPEDKPTADAAGASLIPSGDGWRAIPVSRR